VVSILVAVLQFWMRASALTRLVAARKDVWCMSQLRCVNTIRCGWCDLYYYQLADNRELNTSLH